MGLFTEVRLQASAACRAWTADHGCFSAVEWEAGLQKLSPLRLMLESARLRVSEALSVEGIDPLGIVRKLLIHESSASLSRAELREVGFVHLEAASGIHLYALWRAYEFALARIGARSAWSVRMVEIARTGVPLVMSFVVFGLCGFRPGLIRPLVLFVARWAGSRLGFRWSKAAPIFLALSIDALFGFLFSFGTEHTFAEWAPGELHYAAAWWGGILGYEWARTRGYGGFRSHMALSVASWIAVLPLDLADGRFAPATPILSLVTVEFLVRGGYLALLFPAVLVGFEGVEAAREWLKWASFFLNRGVGVATGVLVRNGFLRGIPEDLIGPIALLGLVWVSGLVLFSKLNAFKSSSYIKYE